MTGYCRFLDAFEPPISLDQLHVRHGNYFKWTPGVWDCTAFHLLDVQEVCSRYEVTRSDLNARAHTHSAM